MIVSSKDRRIIRDLAARIADIATRPDQAEKTRLWTCCNDLKPERAMVLAIQQPWDELAAAWLELKCEDESARRVERALRERLIHHDHIPDDRPMRNEWGVGIECSGGGYNDYGVQLVTAGSGGPDGAYRIEPAIRSPDDLDRLHFRPVTVDHKTTERNVAYYEDLFGDILHVRKIGRTHWRYGLSRVLIHMIGLENMMLWMYDSPDLLHRLMGFLRDDYLNELDLMERELAIAGNNVADANLGSGGLAPNSALPAGGATPAPLKHSWCWAESQETVGVGPEQFGEFVLAYQIPLMNRFGLVDYGCCEPLDQKLDLLVAQVPHLRWLALSPWSDPAIFAEKLGGRYVHVYKPNPSRICAHEPAWDLAEKDIRDTLRALDGLPVHVVMKDTATFHGEAERTTRWCEMAVRVAQEMA